MWVRDKETGALVNVGGVEREASKMNSEAEVLRRLERLEVEVMFLREEVRGLVRAVKELERKVEWGKR